MPFKKADLHQRSNYGLDCFADDTGLEVDSSGRCSRRFFSTLRRVHERNAEAQYDTLLLARAQNPKTDQVGAVLKQSIALQFPWGDRITFEGDL